MPRAPSPPRTLQAVDAVRGPELLEGALFDDITPDQQSKLRSSLNQFSRVWAASQSQREVEEERRESER